MRAHMELQPEAWGRSHVHAIAVFQDGRWTLVRVRATYRDASAVGKSSCSGALYVRQSAHTRRWRHARSSCTYGVGVAKESRNIRNTETCAAPPGEPLQERDHRSAQVAIGATAHGLVCVPLRALVRALCGDHPAWLWKPVARVPRSIFLLVLTVTTGPAPQTGATHATLLCDLSRGVPCPWARRASEHRHALPHHTHPALQACTTPPTLPSQAPLSCDTIIPVCARPRKQKKAGCLSAGPSRRYPLPTAPAPAHARRVHQRTCNHLAAKRCAWVGRAGTTRASARAYHHARTCSRGSPKNR